MYICTYTCIQFFSPRVVCAIYSVPGSGEHIISLYRDGQVQASILYISYSIYTGAHTHTKMQVLVILLP